MKRNTYRIFNTMAAMLAAIVALPQWQFKLDTTFRTSITEQYVNSLAVMPDGKLLLSGLIKFPGDMGSPRGSARLMDDGHRDESFTTFVGGGKLTPWNDQYYVEVGQGLRRLNSEGYLDPTFIQLNWGPYFSPIQGGDYHVFDDGRVLITGSHNLSDSIRGFMGSYKLIWFSNEGYLDTTRIHRQANGAMWRFTALPDGKFLCSCNCTLYEGQPVGRVFRIHEDGSLDTSFMTDIAFGVIYEYFPLPDGRVLLGGNFRRASMPTDTLRLARLLEDGTFDLSFVNPQFGLSQDISSLSGASVHDIMAFASDRYIVTGQFTSVNGSSRRGICMIDQNGNLTSEFHDAGVGPFTYFNVTNAGITNVYFSQDSSSLYICGTYNGYDDGIVNDTLQRFVSRLLVEEVNVAVREEERPKAQITIQPNPASEQVTFIFDQAMQGQASIVIRDLHGRTLASLPIADRKERSVWNTNDVAPGIYFVALVADGSTITTAKLVVE